MEWRDKKIILSTHIVALLIAYIGICIVHTTVVYAEHEHDDLAAGLEVCKTALYRKVDTQRAMRPLPSDYKDMQCSTCCSNTVASSTECDLQPVLDAVSQLNAAVSTCCESLNTKFDICCSSIDDSLEIINSNVIATNDNVIATNDNVTGCCNVLSNRIDLLSTQLAECCGSVGINRMDDYDNLAVIIGSIDDVSSNPNTLETAEEIDDADLNVIEWLKTIMRELKGV